MDILTALFSLLPDTWTTEQVTAFTVIVTTFVAFLQRAFSQFTQVLRPPKARSPLWYRASFLAAHWLAGNDAYVRDTARRIQEEFEEMERREQEKAANKAAVTFPEKRG